MINGQMLRIRADLTSHCFVGVIFQSTFVLRIRNMESPFTAHEYVDYLFFTEQYY